MSERQSFLVRNGFLATGGLAILVLIVLFYATVSGAVDRASHRRAEALDNIRLSVKGGAVPASPRLASLSTESR